MDETSGLSLLLVIIWFFMATVIYPLFVEKKLINLYKNPRKVKEILKQPHLLLVDMVKDTVVGGIEQIVDNRLKVFKEDLLEDVKKIVSDHLKMFKVTLQREAMQAMETVEQELEQQQTADINPLQAIQLKGIATLLDKKPEMGALLTLLLNKEKQPQQGNSGWGGKW